MKKLLLSLMACFAVFYANAWTVYFTNPENWDEVAVWAWTDGADGADMMGTAWPGKMMTKGADGVWSYTQSDDNGVPDYIIFNNNDNGSQTGNLDFVEGATYDMNGVEGENSGNEGEDVAPGPGPETSVEAPAQLYLIGDMVPGGWDENNGQIMELVEEGVFAIEGVEISGSQWFAFTATLGSWNDINANRVGPAVSDSPFNLTEGNPFVWGEDTSWHIQVEEPTTIDLFVNFNTMKVATTLEAAPVKTIGAELNGEEVIYNLHGVRVNRNNMPAGIYIINGKKVAVK